MHRSHAVDSHRPSERLTEVDTRSLRGNAGTVTLYLSADPLTPRFIVDIENAQHDSITSIGLDTGAEALEAYLHPFARADVPDVFGRAA
jgi:hypothetical protein